MKTMHPSLLLPRNVKRGKAPPKIIRVRERKPLEATGPHDTWKERPVYKSGDGDTPFIPR